MILKYDNGCKYNLPISNQRNDLDIINASFINTDTTIPTSFNMIKINDALNTYDYLLHARPEIIHTKIASNKIVSNKIY